VILKSIFTQGKLFTAAGIMFLSFGQNALGESNPNQFIWDANYQSLSGDSTKKNQDSLKLRYPINSNKAGGDKDRNIDFKEPESIQTLVEFDTSTNEYRIKKTIAGEDFLLEERKSFEEYLKETGTKEVNEYFRKRTQAQSFVSGGGLIPPIKMGPKILDKIFGGGVIDIRPQGSAELTFGYNHNIVRNPAFTARQQRNGQFDFKQKIQINLTGSIGERMKLSTNYDTEATFDFDNQMKLNWAGKEDDIIKAVEIGNVSLPLNSGLINGGQSLFGLKTQLQFGRLKVTSIFTQQRGQTTETQVTGGAQVTRFNIQADNYDVNRHFFLSQYFADNYDRWLNNLPVISSPIIINRVEVWVTNRTMDFATPRDVIALMDLGEANPHNQTWPSGSTPFPSNNANQMYGILSGNQEVRSSLSAVRTLEKAPYNLDKIKDFQFLANARQLNFNEYTVHPQLGYISLNTALNNDEILAVAFEYSINGVAYQVGEFTVDVPDNQANPQALKVKMLKGATITTELPIWDLMMKNIYSLGAFNVQKEKFMLDVVYADDFSGADYSYLPVQDEPRLANQVNIRTLNLDNVNVQKEPQPDGIFDYIPGLTINPNTGRIIFPVREPFGRHLKSKLSKQENIDKYVYQELYDSTKWLAQQVVQKNKFFLRGSFQSSSNNEISLNAFNVPQGSVKVTANGTLLAENIDYIVDYSLGKVTIINAGLLESGAVIKVSSENNSLFNIQQKTLVGSRFDYTFNKDLIIGGTIMHMWERPITPKVNIGDEPLLNTIWGVDGAWKTESRWLTKMIDKLPFIQTKEISTLTVTGEFAQLIPHQPKTIGARGTSFIDDFEGSETPFDLRAEQNWKLASVPEGQPTLFPEGNLTGVAAGNRRARLAWYRIDPLFQINQFNSRPAPPSYLTDNDRSDHRVRIINVTEVFPNKQLQNTQPNNLPTLDLAYYPSERGMYNFNADDMNADGTLNEPKKSWGGIMRKIETNDFEAANIDYMEIWMMSPFLYDSSLTGTFYIHLGQISEDVVKDRQKSFENGLPTEPGLDLVDTTDVARISIGRTLNNAFDNDPAKRDLQDVGLDGFDDNGEKEFFKDQLAILAQRHGTGSQAYLDFLNDPSNDNYRFHSGDELDNDRATILDRYKRINGVQGNSPVTNPNDPYTEARTNVPDDEDINGDFSVNFIEQYYQYKIEIDQNKLVPGENFVADVQIANPRLDNGNNEQVPWYLFRIPISAFEKRVGDITDFKSIRFIRLVLSDFEKPVVMRFATLQLVRAEWRRYLQNLAEAIDSPPTTPGDNTTFSTGTVNIEENGFRKPVAYMLPPGFFRTIDVTTPGNIQQNEQSILLRVCNLKDGDARGVFKTTQFDIRNYKKLQMFVHAEEAEQNTINNGDLHAFIRLGTDLEQNYYELSVPLSITPWYSRSAEEIWPDANQLNIDLEEFYLTKQLRSNAGVPLTQEFVRAIGGGRLIKVKGLPDMSNLRVFMLGVRNPLRNDNPNDDGLDKCAEVWFNELRVSEFINQGGWAANGRAVAKLADVGTLTASLNYQSIGFGGIDRKLNERNLNETFMYDISGNLELGKFFPAKSGISIPLFIGHSEQIIRPKFNPLNPDILLETAIKAAPNEEAASNLKRNAEDLTVRRSINFTNIKKNRIGSSKSRFYDIENFNLTYSFSEVFQRNQVMVENLQKTYRGSLGYNFSPAKPPKIMPFKGIGSSPWLALIRDFNFTPYPNAVAFRTDIDRYYARLINRNNDNPNTIVPILYNKNFTLNRFYDVRWDLSNALKLDYQSTAMSRVDEPIGKISADETPDSLAVMLANLRSLGRMVNFNQRATANYTVPLNKIPLFDWVTLNASYEASYEWITAPPVATTLGNTIQNSQKINGVSNLNFVNFYNKIKFLKEINQGKPKKAPQRKPAKKEDAEDEEEGDKKKKKADNSNELKGPGIALLRAAMMLRNGSINYSETRGIMLPGFTELPQYFGNNFDVNAPGIPFIFGSQDPDIRYKLANAELMSIDSNQRAMYTQMKNINLNIRAVLEPFKDFRIDVNMQKTSNVNTSTNYRYNQISEQFEDFGLQEGGSYTITMHTFRTAFGKIDGLGRSQAFLQFENNRYDVSRRLAQEDERWQQLPAGERIDTTGYFTGYGKKSQDVLIEAFLAAYTGTNVNNYNKGIFPGIPLPNWSINYNGLSKNKMINQYASNVSIRHGYSGTYSVGNFVTSLGQDTNVNAAGNYLPKYIIRTVSISEQFTPLIGIDITWKNNIITGFEIKRSRIINLELNSYKVNEIKNAETTFRLGYKVKGLRLPIYIAGKKAYLPNELDIRVDVSIRDTRTQVMEIDNVVSLAASGQRMTSIRPTIDYKVNDKINVRIFYDRRANTPYVSSSFPTIITQGGLSLRYIIQ